MLFVHKININLDKQDTKVRIGAVQGDYNTRAVEVSLYNDHIPWSIPEGIGCVIRYKKPDGHGGVYASMPDGEQAWQTEANRLTIYLAPHVLNVSGLVEVSAALTLGEAVLGIFFFEVQVECDPSDGLSESADYFEYQDLQEINEALSGVFAKLDTDQTLQVAGKCADAKATGDALSGKISKTGDTVTGNLDFGEFTHGLKWTTTDGTVICLRPHYDTNVFQITMQNPAKGIAEYGAISIYTDGKWEFHDAGSVRNALGAAATSELETLMRQRCYFVPGVFFNGTNGCEVVGAGSASVDICGNGLARIDFSIQITAAGVNSTDYSSYGINRDLLVAVNPNMPQITPLSGGSFTVFSSEGQIAQSTTGMGGTFLASNQFWSPARVYEIDSADGKTGQVGLWAETEFQEGVRLVGVCYGRID